MAKDQWSENLPAAIILLNELPKQNGFVLQFNG